MICNYFMENKIIIFLFINYKCHINIEPFNKESSLDEYLFWIILHLFSYIF